MAQLKAVLIIAVLATLCDYVDASDANHGMVSKWGKIVDPDRDCEFQIGDDSLSIRFGKGSHVLDAEMDQMNSSRVVHSIDGDFSVQVTVDGNLPLPDPSLEAARAYISGALLIMQDDRSYIRLERASFTRNGRIWHYANFEQRIAGQRKRTGQFNDFPLPPDGPVQLKFEVRGDQVRGLARRHNEEWHEVGTAVIENRPILLVGVSGVKTVMEESEVRFRELRYTGENPIVSTFSSSMDQVSSLDQVVEPKQPAAASKIPAQPTQQILLCGSEKVKLWRSSISDTERFATVAITSTENRSRLVG